VKHVRFEVVAFVLAAVSGFFLARWGGSGPDPDVRRFREGLRERLDRGDLVDLVALESQVEAAMKRWPEASSSFRAFAAEAAARRHLEFGRAEADRRAAIRWAGPLPSPGRLDAPRKAPFLAWALRADTATAVEALRRVVDAFSEVPSALEARAVLHGRQGQTGRALADLSRALDRAPERHATRRHLARWLAHRGALASAADAFARTEATTSGALHAHAARRAAGLPSTLPPDDAIHHPTERARRGLLALVDAMASGQLDLEVDGAISPRPDHAGLRCLAGDLALLSGRPAAARRAYREALALDERRFAARAGLARVRLATKLDWCDPKRPESLGRVEYDPSRFELARVAFDPAVFPEHRYAALASEDPEAWARGFGVANRVALAEMCLADDRARRAARYLGQAARRRERWVRPELRARALLSAGKPRSALRVAETRQSPMLTVLEARALADLGRLDAARRRVQPVVSSTSAIVPSALALSAKWALEEDDLEPAEAVLDRLDRIAPDRVEVAILRLEHAIRAGRDLGTQGAEVAAMLEASGEHRIGAVPARAAGVLAEHFPDGSTMQLDLFDRALRDDGVPDARRLAWAEKLLDGDRHTSRSRFVLRQLARGADDRGIRRRARRLLRR